jgi:NAD(P)-dependent dehydrogenase (short-subunit alcohol dehydrogenase family)
MGWYQNPAARAAAEALHLTRLGRPEDIAELALFIASDKAEFMTGTNVVMDGGLTAFKTIPQSETFYRTEK